ncbi:Hypothetical predicted protein [Paramuricea clavata]|uniref:Uncharacterized protein n=1 Tax=Paramuricea clavata TaxID=317549 RepID=A0A6S7IY23_PARCT|nr:Hypothetical predicted protein [Paramuricea clavata]
MEKKKETLLNKIYYNPKNEASFGGLEKLYRAARATKNNLNISRNDVREWLRSQEIYSLHKPVRKNYPRTRVFVAGIDGQFEADLADFQSLSAQNDNYRTIKEIPANVTRKNEFQVRQTLYGEKKPNPKFKFNVGDLVKINKTRRPFEKAYNQGWTEENVTIAEQIARIPPVYKIKDFGNEILDGIFYEAELQKVVKKDDVYRVDSILRTRTRNGRKQYLVSWKNYPTKFNSWVDEKDITHIK